MPPSTTIAEPDVDTGVTTGSETKLTPRWKVLLLNDDRTTFAFVEELLQQLFHKPHAEAVRLTREIHDTGSAMITVTSRERAELYVEQVRSLARPRGFPLTAAIEPE